MKHRDMALGILFFAGMAAFGVIVLYVNREKWQAEMAREGNRHRVYQAQHRVAAGHQRLEAARAAQGEDRVRHAREAVALFTYGLEVSPGVAELHAARAEAHELAGDNASAEADRVRARALEGRP